MKKPRLLVISGAQNIGGGEVYLAKLLPQFRENFEVNLLAPGQLIKHLSPLVDRTYRLKLFPTTLEKNLKRNYRLKRLYYDRQFKRLFAQMGEFQLISLQWFEGAVIEAIKQQPLMLTLHTGFQIPRQHDEHVRQLFSSIDQVITVSSAAKKELVSRGIPESKVAVIPNGIDVQQFNLNQSTGEYITWIGRVEAADKNPMLFMQIVRETKKRGLPYKFRVVGDGSYLPELKAYAKTHQLGNVVFSGHVVHEQMKEVYAQASLLCITSTSEGLPLALLEAMACGIPVVSTDVGGIKEALSQEAKDLALDVPDSALFTNAIEKLLGNKQYYNKVSTANHRRILNHYSLTKMTAATSAVYKKVSR